LSSVVFVFFIVPVITQALAPPLPPAYQPQPVQPLPVIISYQMMMMNVDGSLTSLSSCRGFRNYVKARADEVGITGVIQRYHHNDVRIQFEGNEDQVSVFIQFLTACRGQRMIELFEGVSRSSNIVRLYDSFDIITDFSRTVECGGKVHRGRFSDPDHDKSSVYSSDQPYIFNYNASI
jgi:acylphosphatase